MVDRSEMVIYKIIAIFVEPSAIDPIYTNRGGPLQLVLGIEREYACNNAIIWSECHYPVAQSICHATAWKQRPSVPSS